MEKRLKLILPMLATASILFIIYAINGLYPFGDMSISWGDMNQQVIPLLDEFRDMLLGKQDFLFSMQNAGGMNFWGVFLFFIASPFSFLTVFVEKADMFLFMNLLVLLKMMTCAGTAAVFSRKYIQNWNWDFVRRFPSPMLFVDTSCFFTRTLSGWI